MGVAVKGRVVLVLAVAAALAAGWIISGCGSDSSTTAAATATSSDSTAAEIPTGSLTKAEFIKYADEICRKGSEKKEAAVLAAAKQLTAQSNKNPSPQALGKLATVVIFPTYSEVLEQVSQLSVPKGDEATVESMLQKYEADLDAAEADPISATQENLFKDANDASDAYGIESCHF
jgi:hypothetical protein